MAWNAKIKPGGTITLNSGDKITNESGVSIRIKIEQQPIRSENRNVNDVQKVLAPGIPNDSKQSK